MSLRSSSSPRRSANDAGVQPTTTMLQSPRYQWSAPTSPAWSNPISRYERDRPMPGRAGSSSTPPLPTSSRGAEATPSATPMVARTSSGTTWRSPDTATSISQDIAASRKFEVRLMRLEEAEARSAEHFRVLADTVLKVDELFALLGEQELQIVDHSQMLDDHSRTIHARGEDMDTATSGIMASLQQDMRALEQKTAESNEHGGMLSLRLYYDCEKKVEEQHQETVRQLEAAKTGLARLIDEAAVQSQDSFAERDGRIQGVSDRAHEELAQQAARITEKFTDAVLSLDNKVIQTHDTMDARCVELREEAAALGRRVAQQLAHTTEDLTHKIEDTTHALTDDLAHTSHELQEKLQHTEEQLTHKVDHEVEHMESKLTHMGEKVEETAEALREKVERSAEALLASLTNVEAKTDAKAATQDVRIGELEKELAETVAAQVKDINSRMDGGFAEQTARLAQLEADVNGTLMGAVKDLEAKVAEDLKPLVNKAGKLESSAGLLRMDMDEAQGQLRELAQALNDFEPEVDTSEIEAKVAGLSAEVADISIDVSLQNFAREASYSP